jgi:O-antigen chain-terminating methyltransferase
MKPHSFYRAFEDHFRGSREQILERLEIYRPWVKNALQICPQPRALDLGCGRGEWLQFVQSMGFNVLGVDQDLTMLEGCEALQLPTQCEDAIKYLQETPSDAYTVISAFHLVEHLSFDQLQILVRESLRVLQPAGLLILETPNPENLRVSSCSFYLDPSHNKPLPPQLLAFLPEYLGFARVKVLRLQEPEHLYFPNQSIGLQEVVGGVSPDYAVIAQKEGSELMGGIYDTLFEKDYGFSLDDLIELFTVHTESRIEELKTELFNVQASANQAQASANQALAFIGSLKATLIWRLLNSARQLIKKKCRS